MSLLFNLNDKIDGQFANLVYRKDQVKDQSQISKTKKTNYKPEIRFKLIRITKIA